MIFSKILKKEKTLGIVGLTGWEAIAKDTLAPIGKVMTKIFGPGFRFINGSNLPLSSQITSNSIPALAGF